MSSLFHELPLSRDLKCRQGETILINESLTLDGATADLTNCTLTLIVTTAEDTSTAVIEETQSIVDADGGLWQLHVADEDTLELAPGEYVYAVVCEWPVGHAAFPLGATRTLYAGRLHVQLPLG